MHEPVTPKERDALAKLRLHGKVAIVTGGLAYAFIPVAALSLGMVVAMTALEFLVAFLQAFVFTVLTCIYLNDVVNLGDGH
jgi:F-type H+-transporting ATPase subunit a